MNGSATPANCSPGDPKEMIRMIAGSSGRRDSVADGNPWPNGSGFRSVAATTLTRGPQ